MDQCNHPSIDQYNHPTMDHHSKVWTTLDKIVQPGNPNPATDFPTGSVPSHPLERNYSPHPGYPNMPSTGAGPPILIFSYFHPWTPLLTLFFFRPWICRTRAAEGPVLAHLLGTNALKLPPNSYRSEVTNNRIAPKIQTFCSTPCSFCDLLLRLKDDLNYLEMWTFFRETEDGGF